MSRHNNFYFIRMFWGSLRNADWDAAYARGGIFGWIAEFFRAITGFSSWPFFVPSNGEWQPDTIRPILDSCGIPNWGWGHHQGEFFFQVKLRQASWAQYLLQQQGVPISGQLLDESHRTAYRPVPRPTSSRVSSRIPTENSAHNTKSNAPIYRGPVGQIHRAVDHLAKW